MKVVTVCKNDVVFVVMVIAERQFSYLFCLNHACILSYFIKK